MTGQPINFIPMSDYYRASESAFAFASHMHDLHKKISDKIVQIMSTTSYEWMLRNVLKLSI